jgi:putative transposase
MKERTGPLWQARYFSSPLDALYFVRAVRYVELNPVRAGLAGRAEEYPWSSAELHCQGRCSALLAPVEGFEQLNGIANWSKWLRNGLDDSTLATLRRNISQNLPCGTDEFIHRLEATAGRPLRYKPQGREAEMKRDSHPER